MSEEKFKRITPAEVNRDEDGFWSHPELPNFDEGDNEQFKEWILQHRLVVQVVQFEYDAPEELCEKWYGDGLTDCGQWEPSKPEGEGWFILGIWDAEDGPVCYWVRYIEQAHDDLISDLEQSLTLAEIERQETKAEAVATALKEKGLLADWVKFGPDGSKLNMVLMLDMEHETAEDQRHFALCVFDGARLTSKAPEWLREM